MFGPAIPIKDCWASRKILSFPSVAATIKNCVTRSNRPSIKPRAWRITGPEAQSPNGWIEGYVDFSRPVVPGLILGGLALRVTDANDYYSAQIEVVGTRSAQFTLRQFQNGTSGTPLASLTIGATDFSSENYRIHLEANNDTITASLWRVVPGQNALVQEFAGGLVTHGAAPTPGGFGLVTFARDANAVLFDDVTITPIQVPEPKTWILLGIGLLVAGWNHQKPGIRKRAAVRRDCRS